MPYRPSSLQCGGRRSPLHLRTTITRARPTQCGEARALWWWSRASQAHEDADDDRFMRSQRRMRHRLVKIARRRAMWDRDTTSRLWPWQRPSTEFHDRTTIQHLSSSSLYPVRKQDKEEEQQKDDPGVSFHKDFDSFRKAVDKAMERDPYGTLFGRRLWSPASTNNMSWTSFSWFADPKDMKESSAATTSSAGTPNVPAGDASLLDELMQSSDSHSARHANDPLLTDNYVYDPIAGRKVRTSQPSQVGAKAQHPSKPNSSSAGSGLPKNSGTGGYTPDGPRKSIFETLFCENGIDIPVKTYKPPKIYGYGANDVKNASPPAEKPANKTGFENSRKREFQALKASTLGNTIDTSAEFHGKYESSEDKLAAQQRATEKSYVPDPNAPLFSGTTYEGRAAAILNPGTRTSWLQQEGFSEKKESNTKPAHASIPVTKLEPVLDRIAPEAAAKTHSLNHEGIKTSTKPEYEPPFRPRPNKEAWQKKIDAAEKAEDIDLLRSSDVRTVMKTKRQLKQQVESQKRKDRENLEKHYTTKQHDENIKKPIMPASARFDSVWKHIESNPDGIVAKTMKAVGALAPDMETASSSLMSNSESKEQVKVPPGNPKASEPLSVPVTNISAKPHPLSTATVKEGVSRNPFIERHTQVFEPRYSEFLFKLRNVHHAMGDIDTEVKQAREAQMKARYRAQAKEQWGSFTGAAVDAHMEARLDAVTEAVMEVHREAQVEAQMMKPSRMSRTQRRTWRELEAERLDEYAKSATLEEDGSACGFDEPMFSPKKEAVVQDVPSLASTHERSAAPTKRDTDPKGLDEPVLLYAPIQTKRDGTAQTSHPATTATQPRTEPPVFTPAGSPVWNDEQPPPVAELKAAVSHQFTAPFIMLINNGKQGVRACPAPNLPHLAGSKKAADPFEILANLEPGKASQYLAYFPKLQQAGYELVNGNAHKLTFRKMAPAVPEKKAATVLDEMPADIDPPGPSAPIPPPPMGGLFKDRKSGNWQRRVRRQEEVFSGTTTATTGPIVPTQTDATTSVPPPSSSTDSETAAPKEPIFTRISRAVRRVTLTIVALAAGAYTIGLVSEGIGAQAQAQQAITGPRKKIVLPVEKSEPRRTGIRPGIYSSESSR